MRCPNTQNLEVHHISKYRGNGSDNAVVLCHSCHVNTPSYGVPGFSPEPFSEFTKLFAKLSAGYQCQCTKDSWCHLVPQSTKTAR